MYRVMLKARAIKKFGQFHVDLRDAESREREERGDRYLSFRKKI